MRDENDAASFLRIVARDMRTRSRSEFCDFKLTPVSRTIIPIERIAQAIVVIRGHKVMLDADLAALYGVDTRSLVQAVKRNLIRFPQDFAFQLTTDEFRALRSQTVISKSARGGRRSPPFAFTEQGCGARVRPR